MCRSRARIDITSCLLTICRIASFVFCNSIAAPGTAHSKKSNRKSLETSTTEGSLRLRLSVRQASHEEAYDVASHSNAANILCHSSCLYGVVSHAYWCFRQKRAAERDRHPGNTQGRPSGLAADLFCINTSPLH